MAVVLQYLGKWIRFQIARWWLKVVKFRRMKMEFLRILRKYIIFTGCIGVIIRFELTEVIIHVTA